MAEEEPILPEGLPINSRAPEITTFDVTGNEISLKILLKDYRGVLLDFFRGNW